MELFLNTYGVSLRRDNERFVISGSDGKHIVSPQEIKSISIGKGASISSDAAMLAIENGIDVLFIDGKGTPLGRLWSVKYGSISTIRRKQLDFTFSPYAVDWIKDILRQKIDNIIALLIALVTEEQKHELNLDAELRRLRDYQKKILKKEAIVLNDIAPSLRGWEGAAAKVYFGVLAKLMPEEYAFEGRSQHPAKDRFNCLLNYGYGILYGKVEGSLIKAGIDPYVGVLHRDDYNRPVLAYDIIEIFRVWVDYVVMHLCMQKAFNEDCFSIRDDGSVWLEALGRRILIQSVNDYLAEIINLKGLDRSRATHIDLFSSNLAQYLLTLKI